MKFKLISTLLILLIISSFSYAIYLSLEIQSKNEELNNNYKELEEKNAQLDSINKIIDEANNKYSELKEESDKRLQEYLEEATTNKWEIASGTNTLAAYSMFVENCTGEEDCHEDELKTAIDKLLNANGYVQIVETNGNHLYNDVKLSLEGKFIKFKTDRSVRSGAIGIDGCGSSNSVKKGIVLKDMIVKVIEKCEAPGSQSVWAHIQYTN